jgi:hypothetical protein
MLPTKFLFIWPSGFRGEDFKKSANQKQELPVAAMFVNGNNRINAQVNSPIEMVFTVQDDKSGSFYDIINQPVFGLSNSNAVWFNFQMYIYISI